MTMRLTRSAAAGRRRGAAFVDHSTSLEATTRYDANAASYHALYGRSADRIDRERWVGHPLDNFESARLGVNF